MNQHTILATRLGDLTVVRNTEAVVGLYFPHHWYRPGPDTFGPRTDEGFDEVARQLQEYPAGDRRIRGGVSAAWCQVAVAGFEQAVEAVAQKAGRERSQQPGAVGGAGHRTEDRVQPLRLLRAGQHRGLQQEDTD
jgi:hypothetical protein